MPLCTGVETLNVLHDPKHRFQVLTLHMTSFLTGGHSINWPQHAVLAERLLHLNQQPSHCAFTNVSISGFVAVTESIQQFQTKAATVFTFILYFLPVFKLNVKKK